MLYIKLSYIDAPKVIPLASFFILTVFNSYISNFKTKNYFKGRSLKINSLNKFSFSIIVHKRLFILPLIFEFIYFVTALFTNFLTN